MTISSDPIVLHHSHVDQSAIAGSGHPGHVKLEHGRDGMEERTNKSPILIFWESTKACPLSCRHCRAEAISTAPEGELSTDEALSMIEDIARFGSPSPILVLTGGDILMRSDLEEILDKCKRVGIRAALSPAISPLFNEERLRKVRDLGVRALSISLDGIGSTHDSIRGIGGHFEKTLDAMELAKRLGFSVQVNTTVMSRNVIELPEIAKALLDRGVSIWEIFFLISVGRGTDMLELKPQDAEDVSRFLFDATAYGLTVRTVEGPMYRRVANELRGGTGGDQLLLPEGVLYGELSSRMKNLVGESRGERHIPPAITRDGKGIIFISNTGDVFPSGFLPLSLGNIRDRSIVEIYQEDELLRDIRSSNFAGKCGGCSYSNWCGGSRARAYAATGDPLGDDPICGI
ncbi:MAG: TIGR04053 family radical SAM/SPASM domain-containing protein [Actinomycetota bacterium]|nr:TIGR04053 family radical SAM/SPASM domain-containing protein [Actinomycetota bacterium]